MDSVLLSRQVDMGDSEFSQGYIVSAREPAEAHKVINESMKAMLVKYRNSPDFNGNFEIMLDPVEWLSCGLPRYYLRNGLPLTSNRQ